MMTMDDGKELSLRRQIGFSGEYPPFPEMSGAEAVERLDAETHWIRSANLEYYYRYAVIECAKTGARFLVREFTHPNQWGIILKWLADTSDNIEVSWSDDDG